MTDVTLDQGTLAKLQAVKDRVTVRDPDGKLVGYFWPATSEITKKFRQMELSPEEIERRVKESGGRPLAEIIDRLEKRTRGDQR